LSGEEEKRRVIIKIMGEEYVLRSSRPREHMLQVGDHVNTLMQELAEKYPRMSLQKIAVLTSLNLASDLLSLKKDEKKKGEKPSEKKTEKPFEETAASGDAEQAGSKKGRIKRNRYR